MLSVYALFGEAPHIYPFACYGDFSPRDANRSFCVVHTSQDVGSDKLMVTRLALDDSDRGQLVEAFVQLLGLLVCEE